MATQASLQAQVLMRSLHGAIDLGLACCALASLGNKVQAEQGLHNRQRRT